MRQNLQRLVSYFALFCGAFVLSACADLSSLHRDHKALTELVTTLERDKYAQKCAPKEFALAQAHRRFAEVEFKEGDARRGFDHVVIARENARRAYAAAEACRPRDADGDGIVDGRDKCPKQKEDFDGYQDEDGCPEGDPPPVNNDADGDGIVNSDDACPDIPEDLDGFKDSDGCPDLDNDGDGIVDTADRCPMQPETFNGVQDEDGCPEQDGDGDGVIDNMDRCPSEPENYNQYMDEDGCPDQKPQLIEITKKQIVIKERIEFETAKSVIRRVSFPVLDDVVQALKDYPDLQVRIEGHTDNVGNDDYNLRLSQTRADSVHDYIVGKGIARSRLTTKGYGETRPIDTNMTPQGKQKNRRVEFHILPNE